MPTLTAKFETRREAEMTVERLVQELHIERTDIFVTTEGAENSAGEQQAGSDTEAGARSPESREDAALKGRIVVSIDIADESQASGIRAAFGEFAGDDVTTS
jgi:hypothetical protein